jgi:hypothetical protein
MHPWAIEGVPVFNLLMACVDGAGLYYVYRSRTVAAWWKAVGFAVFASFCLVSLFAFGPSVLVRMSLAGYRSFATIRLMTYVLFVHAPICLLGGAMLLRKTASKTAVLSVFAAMVALAVAADAFWIEPTWLEVTHLRIASPKLDRPLRVAVLADLQTDRAGSYERKLFERLRAEKPDLILFAGDYLQANGDRLEKLREELNGLMKEVGLRAPEGVFAAEGNVDTKRRWKGLFEGLSVVTVTATESFDVGPLQLTCLSTGDSFNPGLSVGREDPNRFHLVLGHSPNFALGRIDADLLVAGHTHGGQVRLPWIGALSSGCGVPRAWAAGLTDLPGGAKLLVSRGLGMERGGAPRMRLLCRPELILLDLVPK